jgi:hypothetical protein
MYRQLTRAIPIGQRTTMPSRSRPLVVITVLYPWFLFHAVGAGKKGQMTTGEALRRTGLRGTHLHAASMGAIGLCIGLWIRAKTVDQDERGNAERRALFVGLWPPMFWLIGDAIEKAE